MAGDNRENTVLANMDKPAGWITGYGVLGGTAGAAAATVTAVSVATVLGSMLVGLPLMIVPWCVISKGLQDMLVDYPQVKICWNFLFHASMGILTGFIGLAIVTSFVAIGVNPFTLPALIAVAVSAAIVFATAMIVSSRFRYDPRPIRPAQPPGATMLSEIWEARRHGRMAPAENNKPKGLYIQPLGRPPENGTWTFSMFINASLQTGLESARAGFSTGSSQEGVVSAESGSAQAVYVAGNDSDAFPSGSNLAGCGNKA